MNKKNEIKISVITPSYNQGDYLKDNINSVLRQDLDGIQHIVIDGGSTDTTRSVLEHYDHLEWVSEADEGQADALNKGFKLASGEIIGWLNSDDYYPDNIFKNVYEHFSDPSVDWIVGNLIYVGTSNEEIKRIRSTNITYENLLNNPDIVKQPPTFFRKSALERAGLWNKKYHMVMDYDLWLRLAKESTPRMVNRDYACFRLHQDQKTSPKNLLRQKDEMLELLDREMAPYLCKLKVRAKKRWYWFKSLIKPYVK